MNEEDHYKCELALDVGFVPLDFDDAAALGILADVETLDGHFYACTAETIVSIVNRAMAEGAKRAVT